MGRSLRFCLPAKTTGAWGLSTSSLRRAALCSTPEQGFTFQSLLNQSLQFGPSFHPVLCSELQGQPPGFLNLKHMVLSQIRGKRRLTFYASSLGLVTRLQAKLSFKVSPARRVTWTILCTPLAQSIQTGATQPQMQDGALNPWEIA